MKKLPNIFKKSGPKANVLLKNIGSILLLLLLACSSVYCQESVVYQVTEQELMNLETILTEQEKDLTTALNAQKMLLIETETLNKYCKKLKRETALYKGLAIGGVTIGLAGVLTGVLVLCLK